MNLKEAIQYLVEQGKDTIKFNKVFDRGNEIVFHTNDQTGSQILIERKPPRDRKHLFGTLDGFIAYLNSKHCGVAKTLDTPIKPGIVFVQKESVAAEINYDPNDHLTHAAMLPLTDAEEFAALKKICGYSMGQKALWRILATDLDGCIDPALLLHVAQADVNTSNKSNVKITTTGIADIEVVRIHTIKTADGSIQIPESWTYTGRTWECYDRRVDIPLRLELDISDAGGLTFRFHARRLQTILNEQRQALVETLTGTLDTTKWTIYEGTY